MILDGLTLTLFLIGGISIKLNLLISIEIFFVFESRFSIVEIITGHEVVVSGEIVEETLVIGALPIF